MADDELSIIIVKYFRLWHIHVNFYSTKFLNSKHIIIDYIILWYKTTIV